MYNLVIKVVGAFEKVVHVVTRCFCSFSKVELKGTGRVTEAINSRALPKCVGGISMSATKACENTLRFFRSAILQFLNDSFKVLNARTQGFDVGSGGTP